MKMVNLEIVIFVQMELGKTCVSDTQLAQRLLNIKLLNSNGKNYANRFAIQACNRFVQFNNVLYAIQQWLAWAGLRLLSDDIARWLKKKKKSNTKMRIRVQISSPISQHKCCVQTTTSRFNIWHRVQGPIHSQLLFNNNKKQLWYSLLSRFATRFVSSKR